MFPILGSAAQGVAQRVWWLDARAVERMARQRPGQGRPLSPDMAWAILLLASGDDAAAARAVHTS
jgi:hypothetical protein